MSYSGAGCLRGALIETGLQIAETVITNYLKNKYSGKVLQKTQTEQNKKQGGNSALRLDSKQYWAGKFSKFRKRSGNRRWRKNSRWKRTNYPKRRFYR